MFKVGDPVWCYNSPCWPVEGEVLEVGEIFIRCKTNDKYEPIKNWFDWQVYKRPEDREKLIQRISDQIESMSHYIIKLKEAS